MHVQLELSLTKFLIYKNSINLNFGFQNIFNYKRQLSMSKINKSTNS